MKCPNCNEEITYFENIGVIENRVCPLCKQPISDEQVATGKEEPKE
jgi:hypothetical protein